MPVIKRYSNRKLYDSESKRYVTLEDLADFVRRGEDVTVVDHQTGEDLTSITLMQVIYEEEKKIGGLLPQVFLTRLIRAGGNTVSALRSRLVALDPFQTVDEEIRRRILALVEQGRLDETEGARLQDLLLRRAGQPEAVTIPVRGEDDAPPAPVGVRIYPPAVAPAAEAIAPEDDFSDEDEAAAEALDALVRQVETLEKELERLKQSGGPVRSA